MTSTTELEELTAFAKRLEAERRRIVDQLMATAANKPLDPDLLRQLSNLQGACMAVGRGDRGAYADDGAGRRNLTMQPR